MCDVTSGQVKFDNLNGRWAIILIWQESAPSNLGHPP